MHPESSPSPRRIRVERAIYYRLTANGRRRYEYNYPSSDGRTRWQTVEQGGLKEARQARATVMAKLGRGERVAPSRQTLAQAAEAWLATQAQTQLRPRTRELYATHLRLHVLPKLGRMPLAKVDENLIAELIADLQRKGLAAWSIRGILTPLGRVLGHAARTGAIGSNPMRRLERGERPTVERREQRILDREEIGRLLDAALPTYRPLLETAIFTGLRCGELLGLTWADVDLDARLLRVRKALDRAGNRVVPKTPQAVRDVGCPPFLARTLREHKLASAFTRPQDFVFASAVGTPLYWRNVSARGLGRAVERAGLADDGRPSLRFHDLRHTFASLLIAQGQNVVYVSRQLGHAGPDITLKIYAHLFDHLEHAQRASDALEASFGKFLESSGGDGRRNGGGEERAEVVSLQGFRD